MPQKPFALPGKVLICDAQGRCLPGGHVPRAAALLGRNKHALHRLMHGLGIAGARSRHKR